MKKLFFSILVLVLIFLPIFFSFADNTNNINTEIKSDVLEKQSTDIEDTGSSEEEKKGLKYVEEDSMTHKMMLLVFQLSIILIIANIFGYVFPRFLKLPKVLGELCAGILIGPYALGHFIIPFLHQPLFLVSKSAELPISQELYGFSIIASIILLFLSGLETDLKTFLKFSLKGSAVGIGGVILSFVLGNLLTVFFWPGVESFLDPKALFLGVLSTATSVGITARILSEKRKMSSPEGVTILAAAVLDDVLGIIILAIVIGIAGSSTSGEAVNWGSIGIIASKAFGFWLVCTAIGIFVAPFLTKGLKKFDSMTLIATIAFGIALLLAGLAEMSGLAMIIGSYIAGLSLSQTDIAPEIEKKMKSLYNFFVPIFFCVMGMFVDLSIFKDFQIVLFGLVYTALAIIGKLVGCGVPALATGFNLKGAFRIGSGMLPRGEVTLIIAGIGVATGIIDAKLFGVAIMTLFIASVIAPPMLLFSFKDGASGYRKKLKDSNSIKDSKSIEISFPSQRMVNFILDEILESFRNEEFFVTKLGRSKPIFHVRKDNTFISVNCNENNIIINTAPKDEYFVRLLVSEEVLKIKDLLSGLDGMKSPDMIGSDLLIGMFNMSEDSE